MRNLPAILLVPLAALLAPLPAQASDEFAFAFEDVSHLLPFWRVDEPVSAKLGGAAWLDYDADGDLDLFLPNAPGGDNALFRNDGGTFVDVAATAGLTGDGSGFTGALAADIDNDGWPDLFLSGAGGFIGAGLPSRLYRNRGDGTFANVTASSGIDADHLALMAAFGDIDRDGDLDLFVTSPGNLFSGVLTEQKLYRNDGDGAFTDISAAAGINTALGGCVVSFTDVNGDRLPDILVGNCGNLDTSGPVPMPIPGPWELWRNNGDATFENVADAAGLNARPGYPMALTSADLDMDGDLDWFATGMGPLNPFTPGLLGEQVLFDGQSDGTFVDATHVRGLGGFEWGWGASFADFDNDGDPDLATIGSAAGEFMSFLGPLACPGRVFENLGTGQMVARLDFGLELQATSGLAVADYDADGFLDLVMIKTAYDLVTPLGPLQGDGAPVLMRNRGNRNRSITLRLVGVTSNAMGIGARIECYAPGLRPQVQEVAAGSSFVSTNSPWPTFGLRRREAAIIVVHWPSGLDEAFVCQAGRAVRSLVEGTGHPL
ncbi:MAG: CRTAC1 family protein [Planctomycetota bacterium]